VVGGEGGITDEAGWRGGVQGSVGLAKFRPAVSIHSVALSERRP